MTAIMLKNILYLNFLLTSISSFGQDYTSELVQMALDTELLTNHISKNNSVIEIDSTISLHLDLSEAGTISYTFLNKKVEIYDLTQQKNIEVISWNINFTNISIEENKATLEFRYFPLWKKCETLEFPAYTNGLYFVVKNTFELSNNVWERKSTEVQDIIFQDWMTQIHWKCVADNYIPIESK